MHRALLECTDILRCMSKGCAEFGQIFHLAGTMRNPVTGHATGEDSALPGPRTSVTASRSTRRCARSSIMASWRQGPNAAPGCARP